MPDSKESSSKEGAGRSFTEEEAYWREKHSSQSYARKNQPYEDYAPAYRIGYEAFLKHPGKEFEEVEDDIALDYEKATPGSPLPWDTVRPAVKAVWERMTGVIPPREPDRGVRDFI